MTASTTLPTPTDDQHLELVTLLAQNYGRPLDDPAALAALVALWREGIGGCSMTDIEEARRAQLRDESARFFPDIGQFRARVIAAAHARRTAARVLAGGAPVTCATCDDSGWLDAGTDDRGQAWVRPCPKGCRPPLSHRKSHPRIVSSRNAPDQPQQLALSAAAVEAGVAAQHRSAGDRVPGESGDPLAPF